MNNGGNALVWNCHEYPRTVQEVNWNSWIPIVGI